MNIWLIIGVAMIAFGITLRVMRARGDKKKKNEENKD